MNKYIPHENKIRKNKLQRLVADHKASIFLPKFRKFLWRIWKIKSLASHLNLCPLNELAQVTAMQSRKVDKVETQHDRLSSQEWCNCKNCEKMPTSLECVCCHETSEINTFNLKGKARPWNTAALEFCANLAKNSCE